MARKTELEIREQMLRELFGSALDKLYKAVGFMEPPGQTLADRQAEVKYRTGIARRVIQRVLESETNAAWARLKSTASSRGQAHADKVKAIRKVNPNMSVNAALLHIEKTGQRGFSRSRWKNENRKRYLTDPETWDDLTKAYVADLSRGTRGKKRK